MHRIANLTLAGWLAALALAPCAGAQDARLVPDAAETRLTLSGTSSLHDWHIEGGTIDGSVVLDPSYREAATVREIVSLVSTALHPVIEVTVPVESLDSGKWMMNRKMRAALEADDHPAVTYRLDTAVADETGAADGAGTALPVRTTGTLTVAGSARPLAMTFDVELTPGDRRLILSGSVELDMTEFGIDPPTVVGLLKTGKEVTVDFRWALRPADPAR